VGSNPTPSAELGFESRAPVRLTCVPEWPPIGEPELLERLSMDDEAFEAFVETLIEGLPPREFEAALLERAIGYPWSRPEGSFRLVDDAVELLEEMSPERRAAVEDEFESNPERHPVLAFGANSSPEGLRLKFAHFPDPEDRTALVLTGWLHDFDVGAAAQHTLYLTIPATIFPSPGTRVRAALVWVTARQFTQLLWSEMNYRFGRLRTRFDVDGAEQPVEEVLAFVSRFGALHLRDGPVALAAAPAKSRTAEALTQEEILCAVAELTLGEGANAETLLRAACEDFGGTARKAVGPVRSRAVPFASDRWTPYGLSPPG
jgi:hypothetical protein